MNTRDLERLAGWQEHELAWAVVAFVRTRGRLPSLLEMQCLPKPRLPAQEVWRGPAGRPTATDES